jgi:AcrR family transcriptional regulator
VKLTLNISKDRKLKERLDRDELILSVAQQLVAEKGMVGLSMQSIADLTDYSKGTIYQHYGCKEDVVAKLVIRCGQQLIAMIDLAIKYGTSARHKVLLVSAAYFINSQRQPEVAPLLSKLKSPEIKVKLSQKLQQEFSQNEDDILKRILTLFSEDTGFDASKIMDAAFGWWTMQWGLQDIMANGWDMSGLGYAKPEQFFFRSLHMYLDGLGIAEDASCHDWEEITQQAQKIFQTNCEQ